MEQQDLDKFIEVINGSSFVKEAAKRRHIVSHAFKQGDLSDTVKNATNAMKRFGDIARNSLPLQ